MPDDAKRTLTPKLRFPEFAGTGDWIETGLRDQLKIPATYGIVTAGEFQSQGIPMLRGGDIKDGKVGDGLPLVSQEIHYQYKRTALRDGDVVIALVGYPGEAAVVPPHYVGANISRAVGLLRVKDSLNRQYLVSYLNSPVGRAVVLKPSAGSAQVVVNLKALNELRVPIPSSAEQQKIADCLTSLDEVIAAQGRKVEALKAHKKGLMQQLFPREGETLPRLRFPEFRDAGEWEERKAGTLFANRKTKGEDGLPIYSVTMHDGLVRRDSFDRDFYDIEDAAGNKKACKNDIAYNMMRMWQGACGVAPEDCLVSPAYVVLAPLPGVVSEFFEYFFKLPASLLLLTSHSRGLTKDRLRLYYDDFAKMPLRVPDEPEQQRIAACLSSVDARIATEVEKLAALKTHKKGLMQQLFPLPEGV